MKKKTEEAIVRDIQSAIENGTLEPTEELLIPRIVWHEKTMRRDADNIVSAKKFILDALQKAGIISNDNRKHIKYFREKVVTDKEDYVEVWLENANGKEKDMQ